MCMLARILVLIGSLVLVATLLVGGVLHRAEMKRENTRLQESVNLLLEKIKILEVTQAQGHAILSRVVGKDVPVKLPAMTETRLTALERKLANEKTWPASA